MATEILNGPITGPYLADDGDIIVVSDDAVVRGFGLSTGVIAAKSTADSGISIIVDGRVVSTSDATSFFSTGIQLVGQAVDANGDPDGYNLVHVREGGVVRGDVGISLVGGQYNTIVVSGLVRGVNAGIETGGDYTTINISGRVADEERFAVGASGDWATVTNNGWIAGVNAGVFFEGAEGSVVTNFGFIRGHWSGIILSNSDNATVLNSGVIRGTVTSEITYFTGVQIVHSDGFFVNNVGRVAGDFGISVSSSTGTIDNSGNIVGGIIVNDFGNNEEDMLTIHNTRLITDTKDVDGKGIILSSATGFQICNEGRIAGGSVGLEAHESVGTVNNSGTISGQFAGVFLTEIYPDQGDPLYIDNSGKVIGQNVGLSIRNTFSEQGEAIRIDNSGIIKGQFVGLSIEGAYSESVESVRVDNSGTIVGQSVGLSVESSFAEQGNAVVVHNSGLIKGEASLFAQASYVHVTNMGVMHGDIVSDETRITLINGGKIVGSVMFSDLDDTYQAIDGGFVSKFVFAGDGQDQLAGGARGDDLRGGLGDDFLIGMDGADILRGGGGNDQLEGGAKSDVLAGGGGNDVFVFGAGSGTDKVMDFQDGKDSLRIADHAGGFDALVIVDQGADLRITHDGGVIRLIGEAGTVLTNTDFDFV